jgi:hypothetical protein
MDDLADQGHSRSLLPPIMNDTADEVQYHAEKGHRTSAQLWFISSKVLKVVILCFAAFGVLSLSRSVRSVRHDPLYEASPTSIDARVCDCGASTDEALSLGCQFVEMAAAWLPSICIDKSLSAEFDRSGPGPNGTWSYYSDASLQHPLTVGQVSLLANTQALFYSTWEWHVKHCTFQWRLDYRRRWLKTVVEPRYDHESHVTHCEGIFLSARDKSVGSNVRLNSSNHLPKEHSHKEDGVHHFVHN